MELDRLEKRIRALQARKAARAATFERVQGIDPTEHEAAVYHAIHEDIAADAHTYYNLPGGRGSCKSSFVSLEIVDGIQKDPTGTGSAVVFRRWGSTLRESVFAQIQWAIDALGVSDLWSCTVSPMRCTYLPTGAQMAVKELYKMLPYVITLIVLIIVSLRKKREDQPPASLGLSYFREER